MKNTKKATWQVSLPTSLRQSNPLLVTDEQETGKYLSKSQCPFSCPSVELPTQLFSSLSAPWAPPALQDPFRHVPVCCTSCILVAHTLFAEYAPKFIHCKIGKPDLRMGARLSVASKTSYSAWFLLISSGFCALCKVVTINNYIDCHATISVQLIWRKRCTIIKEKSLSYRCCFRSCARKKQVSLHCFLKVSWLLV